MNPYNHRDWLRFREEVIAIDKGQCVRCGRSRADGIVLQVHHKSYEPNRLPWQYDYSECETLCKGCHAQEHGIIMPHSDWELIGSDDLGDLSGECDYCGTALRHTYAIMHPKWGSLTVGTDCCDRLTMTNEASEYVKLRQKRSRFVSSSRWEDQSGTHSIDQAGIFIQLIPSKDKFIIGLDESRGKVEYNDLMAAKLKAFDLVETGGAASYLAERRRREREKRRQANGRVG